MPKEGRSSVAKTARLTPYSKLRTEAPDTKDIEPTSGTQAGEGDSSYYSSTENSFQEGPDEQYFFTHPRCYGNDHVEKLEIFAQDLEQALENSFPPTARTYPYTGVSVLLLRWMEDDLQVQQEIDKLSDVFAHQFAFQVEQWQIPSSNPTRILQTKLYNFQNSHQSKDELLIVYYGGHSEADPRRGRSLWRANNRPNSPSLNWSSLQHLLETAVPYVLIILDCCFAANAARDTAEGSTKEILAACGRENRTLGVCDRSFTSVLVEELQAFGSMPFTVAMLHLRLVTMRWRLAFTPIYALLSENGGSSITMSPIPQNSLSLIAELDSLKEPVALEGVFENSTSFPVSQSHNLDTRVLLSVSIAQEAELDLAKWTTWLATSATWDILKVDVQIEGVFRSHSTLVLVSIPTTGWNLLAERPAYKFIGFIRSPNLLPWDKLLVGEGMEKRRQSEVFQSSRRDPQLFNDAGVSTPREREVCHANQRFPQSVGESRSHLWLSKKDKVLMRARQQGLEWQSIASQYFPDKTANTCRKRHERLIEKRKTAVVWDSAKVEKLLKTYTGNRRQMWKIIADEVVVAWEACEAKCMAMGHESIEQELLLSTPRTAPPTLPIYSMNDLVGDNHPVFGNSINGEFLHTHPEGPKSYGDSAIGLDEESTAAEYDRHQGSWSTGYPQPPSAL